MSRSYKVDGGINVDLEDDSKILEITSPKNMLTGPYFVVYKEERWAIVAMRWDNNPALGIRWFYNNGGNPFSSAHPTWLVIPGKLNAGILNTLPLETKFRSVIDEFLFRSKIDEILLKELGVFYKKINFLY